MIRQISVFLENRSGQLVQITSALSEAGIDLRALNIAETAQYGVLRMIADDPNRGLQVLSEKGFVVTSTPVVAATVPDRPGSLNEILCRIAAAGIDLEYMYSAFGGDAGTAQMVFRVSDGEALESLLSASGIRIASEEDFAD